MENFRENRCVMGDLIGKTVAALSINDDQSVLVVTHDQGRCVYTTWADCCSETWIADILGVCNLIGQKVVAAEDVELEDVDDGRTRQEYDQFFGIRLTTTRGYVDIVYRNSSNGYYGGDLFRGKDSDVSGKLIAIEDDYSA